MRSLMVSGLALALAACGGGDPPADPGGSVPEIAVPQGRACSDVILVPQQSVEHVPVGTPVQYVTDPPTSGRHWNSPPQGPAPIGIYTEPVPDEATVHNLEHGHVIVHHNGLPEDVVTAIAASVRTDPVMMLMVPRPEMPWMLALTAWNHIQVCAESPPEPVELLRSFVGEHRDQAPESVPG